MKTTNILFQEILTVNISTIRKKSIKLKEELFKIIQIFTKKIENTQHVCSDMCICSNH